MKYDMFIESYDFIRFIVLLEEKTQIEIPDEILVHNQNTFKELFVMLEEYGVNIKTYIMLLNIVYIELYIQSY